MIGDSTTKRVTPWLAEHQPSWHVDGKGGRPVRALPGRIEVYLRSHPAPADFIMALGTNRSFNPDWTKERLVHAINKLPAETNVYLMMVVRAGRFQAWKDAVLRDYNPDLPVVGEEPSEHLGHRLARDGAARPHPEPAYRLVTAVGRRHPPDRGSLRSAWAGRGDLCASHRAQTGAHLIETRLHGSR